jgi:ferrous iron transport protein A
MLRVQELGLCTGTEVEVMKVAPFGDPVELRFRDCRYCMRKHDLSSIEVEIDDSKMA